jgi:outer membrane protein insertion porin family
MNSIEIQNNFKTTIEKNDNYFDGLYLQNHLDNLIKFFQNSNLPFYTFEANIMTDNIENSSNLVIKSEKIKLNLINKINISGNSITKDKVIRSRLNFESGDYLNNFYIDRAKEDLKKLPYINSVEIKYSEIDNMNSDIDINISENKKTGDISLAGFFSSDAGAGITFAINDSNIFGSGNQLKLNMDLSEEYVQFTSSYSKISLKKSIS